MVSIFRDEDRDRDEGMGKISHNPDLLLVRYFQLQSLPKNKIYFECVFIIYIYLSQIIRDIFRKKLMFIFSHNIITHHKIIK